MRIGILFLVFSLVGSPVSADTTETCCVEPDIAAAFLPNVIYSRTWPADFPLAMDVVDLPFVGSSRGLVGAWNSVAWRLEAEVDDPGSLVARTLENSGWQMIPQNEHLVRVHRGFVSDISLARMNNAQFCRARDGQLTLSIRESGEHRLIVLNHNQQNEMDCAQTIASHRIQPQRHGGVSEYLPIVRLPTDLARQSGGGYSSGGDSAESRMYVNYSGDVETLVRGFVDQVEDQGWVRDTDFRSSHSFGMLWRKTTQGLTLSCMITAIQQGNRTKLRMWVHSI